MPSSPRASRETDSSRSRLRPFLALVVALWAVAPRGRALADEHAAIRAVILTKDFDAPIARKLRAELTVQGFEAVLHAPQGEPPAAAEAPPGSALIEIERVEGARVVLRVDDAAYVVEVWVSGSAGTRPTMVDKVGWGASPDDEGVAAVQAAETLRAVLERIETGASVSPPVMTSLAPPRELPPTVAAASASAPEPLAPPAAAPPPSQPSRLVSAKPARLSRPAPAFGAALGPAVVVSPGGLGPMGDVSLAAWWRLYPSWSIGAFGLIPAIPASITGKPEGSARAEVALVGAEVVRALDRPTWIVHPEVGIGGGATWLHASGQASSGFVARSSDVWMALVQVRAGAAVSLARHWRARADGIVGFTLPQGAVAFAGAPEATWGHPVVVGALALEFDLRWKE